MTRNMEGALRNRSDLGIGTHGEKRLVVGSVNEDLDARTTLNDGRQQHQIHTSVFWTETICL